LPHHHLLFRYNHIFSVCLLYTNHSKITICKNNSCFLAIIYTEYPVWIEWVDLYRISRGSCLPVNEKFYQALAFQEQNELTEEMKEKLIDKVLVYPDNKIEIHLGKRAIITGN